MKSVIRWIEFASLIVNAIDDDSFLRQVMYTDEETFNMIGHLNRHNCGVWGQEQLHEIYEHVWDSQKVNVWVA
jgi:hypothetical protein